jgi:tripartite-type tricarboxylate transporter receptor subunit TctC
MAPFIAAGKVKALGTSGTTRSVALPDVPTLAEAGVPGYEATIWIGMVAPVGTPQAIVDRLNREINAIITRPDIKESWEKQDAKPDPMTPAEFGAHIEAEIAKWAKLIKANNIKAQ